MPTLCSVIRQHINDEASRDIGEVPIEHDDYLSEIINMLFIPDTHEDDETTDLMLTLEANAEIVKLVELITARYIASLVRSKFIDSFAQITNIAIMNRRGDLAIRIRTPI